MAVLVEMRLPVFGERKERMRTSGCEMGLEEAEVVVQELRERLIEKAGLSEAPSVEAVLGGFRDCAKVLLGKLSFMDGFRVHSPSGDYAREAEALNVWLKENHTEVLNEAQPVASRVNVDRLVEDLCSILKDGLTHAISACTIEGLKGIHTPAGRHRGVLLAVVFGFGIEVPVVLRYEPSVQAAKMSAQRLDEARRKEYVEGESTKVYVIIKNVGPLDGPEKVERLRCELRDGKVAGHGKNSEGRRKAMIVSRISQWVQSGLAAVAEAIGMPPPRLGFIPNPDGVKGLTLRTVSEVIHVGSSLRSVGRNVWECMMRLITNMEFWITEFKRYVDEYAEMARIVADNPGMVEEAVRERVVEAARLFLDGYKSGSVFASNHLKEEAKIGFKIMYGQNGELCRTPDAVDDRMIQGCARRAARAAVDISVNTASAGNIKGAMLRRMYQIRMMAGNPDFSSFLAAEERADKFALTKSELDALRVFGRREPRVPWEEPAKKVMRALAAAAKGKASLAVGETVLAKAVGAVEMGGKGAEEKKEVKARKGRKVVVEAQA